MYLPLHICRVRTEDSVMSECTSWFVSASLCLAASSASVGSSLHIFAVLSYRSLTCLENYENSPLSKRVADWGKDGRALNYGIVWGRSCARSRALRFLAHARALELKLKL